MPLCILVVPHLRYNLAFGGDYPGCIFFSLLVLLLGGVGRTTGNTTGWLCDTSRRADYYAEATMRAPKLPSKEYTGFMHSVHKEPSKIVNRVADVMCL